MNSKKEQIPELARVVERNVNTLLNRKKKEDRKRTVEERLVDSVTSFVSSMLSVYVHLVLFGVWIFWNTGLLPLKPFDPSFVILAMFAAVEAIFLTTFVLIGQKRINIQADKWAELDLQVSLLTEHEVTRLLNLITAIARKMEIEEAHDKEIEELSKETHPEKVLDTMEKASK
ncbi:MAG TPA: DUF1003 domain-containing protein [Chitinophagaceae bacterium]|jgi:uncharacterized membrane protein|nr:DUF1003 domain-containing protein [Chitinophagaceae bacterium]